MWGLYDTGDNTWVGDDAGPRQYEEEWIAMVGAQIFDVMAGQEPGRTRHRELPPGPYRHKEKVDTEMTALEAIQAIEAGKV